MNDKIKSNITTCYMLFVFDFGDPSSVDRSQIESEIKGPVSEVFSSQKKTDFAKKTLGKAGFDKMLSLYFSSFQTQDGLKYKSLEDELVKNKKVFMRHLGKDKVNYLNLIVNVLKAGASESKGLLGRVS